MKTNGGGTCDGEKGPANCMEDLAGGSMIIGREKSATGSWDREACGVETKG